MSMDAFADRIVTSVRSHVARALEPLTTRLSAAEQRIDAAPPPSDPQATVEKFVAVVTAKLLA